MCTKEDNEQLTEALIAAARAAFLSLKETTKEHFYVFVFDEDKSWWKWDSADSPYAVYGYDEFFCEVGALLEQRASKLSHDELYETEWEVRIDLM